jgi:glycosyltransferase involved in cell wall biosynthesis
MKSLVEQNTSLAISSIGILRNKNIDKINNMNNSTKLSIIMMTYNQGKFIDKAITSVLNQELPDHWELLIGDDASSDDTEIVVSKWLGIYPNNIFYFKHQENKGLHRNYVFLMGESKGEFIALLEADDYWIDPLKTKKQLYLLEVNKEMAWVSTDGCTVDENENLIKFVQHKLPEKFDFNYFLNNYYNPLNNSTIFRKKTEPNEYPKEFYKVKQWDTFLYYLRSFKGEIGHLNIDGLAWRRHENATSFSASFTGAQRYKDWIVINDYFKSILPKEQHSFFSNYSAYEFLSLVYFRKKSYFLFLKYFFKMFLLSPTVFISRFRDYFWKIRN